MASWNLSIGVCMAALVLASTPARAQDQSQTTAPEQNTPSIGTPAPDVGNTPAGGQTPSGGSTASANQATAAETGDIVVTANRVSSLASKTPIALSAIDGDTLRSAGITTPATLGDQVPNLNIIRSAGLQITIRGVTSADSTEKGDPSAAFLLDGIYIARPQVQEVSFYDIQRVEVLRGPQGTLYGRNTTAGVVNVITNRPTDRFAVAGNVGYGNFNAVQADGMINVPVNDFLALRFSGSYDRRDSYIEPVAGDRFKQDPFRNNLSGRAQALFSFGDASLLIRGDYAQIRGRLQNVVSVNNFYAPIPAGAPAFTDPQYIGAGKSSEALRSRSFPLARDLSTRNHTYGVDAEFNWDLGPVALTYLGSHRHFERHEDGSLFTTFAYPSRFDGKYNQNSHELRIATSGEGPLQAQIGGYYFREKSGIGFYLLNLLPTFPVFGFPQDPTIAKTIGGFGQATYSITPSLRVTGGARYSKDDKSREGFTVFQKVFGPFNPATDNRSLNTARQKSSKVTWRAGVDFDIDPRTLAYGTVSTGYKAGGFNDGCSAGVVTDGVACNQIRPDNALYYQPETLTSYEIGLKTRTLDNALRLAASAFYYDYNNLQLTGLVPFGNTGTTITVTTNAAKARVKGVELEATLTPSPRNKIDLSFTYLDARYREYSPLGAGRAPDYAGRHLDRSPPLVGTVGYLYTLPFGNGSNLAAGVRSRISDGYVTTNFSFPRQYRQPSFTQTDATLTYSAPDNLFYVQGFARNLEDTITVNSPILLAGDPRTYGVRAGFKF